MSICLEGQQRRQALTLTIAKGQIKVPPLSSCRRRSATIVVLVGFNMHITNAKTSRRSQITVTNGQSSDGLTVVRKQHADFKCPEGVYKKLNSCMASANAKSHSVYRALSSFAKFRCSEEPSRFTFRYFFVSQR